MLLLGSRATVTFNCICLVPVCINTQVFVESFVEGEDHAARTRSIVDVLEYRHIVGDDGAVYGFGHG